MGESIKVTPGQVNKPDYRTRQILSPAKCSLLGQASRSASRRSSGLTSLDSRGTASSSPRFRSLRRLVETSFSESGGRSGTVVTSLLVPQVG